MDKVIFFWNGWEPLLRILVVGSITYFGIVLLLRISGKRTLASMNAFDFIVTVAMGSAFGRILTAKQVSIAEALTTFALLVSLQFIISFLQKRSKLFSRFITSEPTLLYYHNQFLEKNMRKERIRKESLLASVRKNKLNSLEEVDAIVLETDGTVSVIKKGENKDSSSFEQLAS
ncbi:DUF421 domain-containing protein [Rufibacter roseus]|uniref:DUF421 domain-containing protein n=1 Tax=Rufibacter roseus TaxID=1567108 RepID=A0ABW2DM46_9BACT|nr:YetF domain-containing protein [Rufibacter roseus]